jgi:thymidine kinase
MEFRGRDGWIEVICGSMFAGKTEELIRRITRIKYAKKDIIVFKPSIDDRYEKMEVVSHSQRKVKSVVVKDSTEIKEYIDNLEKLPYAIAIDEAQFFDRGLIQILEDLANKGTRVIVAGLDLDFRGEPFGIMPDILARAEYVTKLHAICQVCGDLATRTQRIIDNKPAYYEDEIILVSAKEKYEARCRHCHEVPHHDK